MSAFNQPVPTPTPLIDTNKNMAPIWVLWLQAFVSSLNSLWASLASLTTTVGGLASATLEAVNRPTLLNGWANYGSGLENAGYWKDPFGIVHIQGNVAGGTIGQPVFTLPAGYVPGTARSFVTRTASGINWLNIDTSGNVIAAAGGNAYFGLDGITFRP